MDSSSRNILALAAIGAIVVTVFLLDMATPFGLGIPFLYLLAILIALGTRQSNPVLLALAVICTCLTVLKLQVSEVGGIVKFGQGNRLIFTLLLWLSVCLELARRHVEERIRDERQKASLNLERLVQERTEALFRANSELQREVAERKLAEQSIQDYAQRVHNLADQLVEAQEVERTRLAAELHDRIGQNLSALNISLNLNLSQLPADTPPEVRARFRDSLALVEQTTEMVRGVMEELHPALLDQYGLGTALRWYGDEFGGRTGLNVVNDMPDLFPRLGRRVEITLFRIVQEALTNAAKHSGANQVRISLVRTTEGIEMRVCDDGIGMDKQRAGNPAAGSGWGLAIMAERARSIGASFRIDSQFREGTCIVATIPNGSWENSHANHRPDR